MQSSEVENMARVKNDELYRKEETVEVNKPERLSSLIKAEEEREKRVDSIRLRVPKGMREQIQDYVVTLPKYQIQSRNPANPPKPNVNAWLVDLIQSQLPVQPEDDKV